MRLEIQGHHFPGRSWQTCANLHVGLQVRREPVGVVAADSVTALWHAEIDVVDRDEEVDFRGPAVQGPRGQRFVYLTWGDVDDDGSFTMVRRAKLMLGDLTTIIAPIGADSRIIARVDLTDECGGPRCARLRPPALEVRADP